MPLGSLSGHDPYLPSNDHGVEGKEERGVTVKVILEASTSWGSQLNLASDPLPEEDVLELDCGKMKMTTFFLLRPGLGCSPRCLSGWR